ncbi:MAG TPA: hypothetical protein VMB34_27745 [Acetobacteraceae bacterium]|nr:hypothetical protein [Acetobacteraceae bacterium]
MHRLECWSTASRSPRHDPAWAYATIPGVEAVPILSSTAVRADGLRRDVATPDIVVGTEPLGLASIGDAGPLAEFYATTELT